MSTIATARVERLSATSERHVAPRSSAARRGLPRRPARDPEHIGRESPADGVFGRDRRPQITTPQAQWTKEDWQARYQGVYGQYGTYSVSGDKLTLKAVSAMAPESEGKDRVVTFRKDGADVLVTSIGTNGSKTETRFRPVK